MRSQGASFDDFVAGHVRDLMGMAYLISCDEAEAEDLVQDCLLKLATRWQRVRAMKLPIGYARRILLNLALDRARGQTRRRRELTSGQDDVLGRELVDTRAEITLDTVATRAALLDALGELSPQQRAVIVLRYFHDLSEAETAKLLGCGVGTVKSSTARGLARMRSIVEPPPSYTTRSGSDSEQ